jgi:hypothetical protein
VPTTNSRTQTMTPVVDKVTINVRYNAVFSTLERHLAANGLVFQERIRVIAKDAGTAKDQVLHTFSVQSIPVKAGIGLLSVARDRSITVSRASLQEDPGLGDADEIHCSIEITPLGLPTIVTDGTPEQTLPR